MLVRLLVACITVKSQEHQIRAGAFAERILLSSCASTSGRTQEVAGVLVSTSSDPSGQGSQEKQSGKPLRLLLACKYVISAGGALHTPALLLRSGVTVGGNVGANLRLHPATVVTAVFPKVRDPWDWLCLSLCSVCSTMPVPFMSTWPTYMHPGMCLFCQVHTPNGRWRMSCSAGGGPCAGLGGRHHERLLARGCRLGRRRLWTPAGDSLCVHSIPSCMQGPAEPMCSVSPPLRAM